MDNDLPSPHRIPPISQHAVDEAGRRRAIEALERALRLLVVAAGRDYAHCGKAAYARSRRCRGFACEPESDHDTEGDAEADAC